MKLIFQVSALLGFTARCSAQVALFGELPNCAKDCATNSLPASCHLDVKCICSDSSFISGISCCVATQCTAESDRQTTLQVAMQLCDSVQVTLPSAVPTTCAASGASSTGPASSSMMASTGTTAMAMSSAASAMSGSSSTGSTSSSTASSKSATSPTSSTTAQTGAAINQNVGSKIGAVGAAVAALALL